MHAPLRKSASRTLHLLPSLFFVLILTAPQTHAVPPPDFIFNAGSIVVQVFSITALFLTGVLNIFLQFLKVQFHSINRKKKLLWISFFIFLIAVASLEVGYLYNNHLENQAYEEWLMESQKYDTNEEDASSQEVSSQLNLGEAPDPLTSDEAFVSLIDPATRDASLTLIENYYKAIAEGHYEEAYALSKKSASFETFKSWYRDTTQIVLNKATRIDESNSSLELTLYEGEKYTSYGVLMTLKWSDETPISIQNSQVQILSQGTKGATTAELPSNAFYSEHSTDAMSISNEAFQKVISNPNSDYLVLDARENLEYENGHFADSTHIRFADLVAGRWIEVPTNKQVYVLCWSGIRGKEVTEFLRTKNVTASYLEGGASGWVEWGGAWIGKINFAQTYSEERYKLLFTTEQVKDYVEKGVILVDSREPSKFASNPIPGSYNIPILYTPTNQLDEVFGQIPPGSTIISICDAYVNCFDAKITAVELESRGHTFLGRYNKPWEYAQ